MSIDSSGRTCFPDGSQRQVGLQAASPQGMIDLFSGGSVWNEERCHMYTGANVILLESIGS